MMNHPKRNMLTNALGIWSNIRIDLTRIDDLADTFLLCSDGLHGYVPDLSLIHIWVNRQLPVCTVVNMKNQNRAQSGILSDVLRQKIADRIKRGEQAILLLNRRGYSPLIKCGQCGETLQCPHCDVALSYHKSIQKMKCHLCGSEFPLVTVCPKCGSRTFAAPGYGTQKLEEEVTRLFPQARVCLLYTSRSSRCRSRIGVLT